MRGRTMIRQLRVWPSAPFFITALLSAAILCWWLVPKNFNGRAYTASATSVDDNEADAALQRAASEALGTREGTIIVMDAQTGRLRAVVNSSLAFEQSFSPGSTIKPFTALAAMQAGLINESSRLLCHEHYRKSDFEISCSHPKIGAAFDPKQAIAYSCNYYFGKLGERLDEQTFDATLSAFGFGVRTNAVDEREASGSLPRGGRFKASHALGEGRELQVTPVQLLTAYAALVNGGHLFIPQAAAARSFNQRERASLKVAPEHRALLIEGMRGAVVYGTAERAALSRLPLYIFGKTGTATASDQLHTHGWFIGFAAQQSQAQDVRPDGVELAVLVFLRNSHGASCAEVARPVFEAFAARQQSAGRTATRESNEVSALPSSAPSSAHASEVRVHLAREGRTVSVPFEDYVLGVLAAEGAVEEQPEALKALAVVVRTYALQNLNRHAPEGYDFCNTTHCQRYTFVDGVEKESVSRLIRRALDETSGEVLLDEKGQVADAYFHAACGGMTANVETLWGGTPRAYLRGVRDEYCTAMPHRDWTDVIPAARLAAALGSDPRTDVGAHLERVIISKRDATARAQLITLEGARRRVVRGWDFKIIVGRALGWNVLKSSRFEVARVGANFVFRGGGFGHGVGLCQEGAHVMAGRGASYRQILNYYFPGTSTGSPAPGIDVMRKSAAGFRASGNAVAAWRADVLTKVGRMKAQAGASPSSRPARPCELRGSTNAVSQVRKGGLPPPTLIPSNLTLFCNSVSDTQPRRLSLASEHFRLSYPAGVEQRDAADVLRTLESTRASLLGRVAAASLSLDELPTLDVSLHATTGDFVAATGQPWWAAGASRGSRIELQPLNVLRRRGVLLTTLRHEYAHVVIDALGHGRAPRWLAEGLAMHVAGEGRLLARFELKTGFSTAQLEQQLSQPASAEEMRALYATAYRQVQALIRAEGESSVWRRVAQV